MNITIETTDNLPEDIETLMHNDLVAYEKDHGIICSYKRFSLVLKENDDVIGVLNAFTAFSEVYIDDIWVHSSFRGNGYGRRLIDALENQFEGKGYNNMNLVTSAFQAPEFYKKCGFQIEFVRENKYNPKLTKTFFVKFFKNTEQYQGVIK